MAWFTLAVNLAVILWGAYVRATGSGAGCGGSWPLCNGDVIPLSRTAETFIEYTHRITSGIGLLLVIGLVYLARHFPPGQRVRRAAIASGIFIIIEALIGAGLVLFDLVGGNTSTIRAFASAVHLSNTFLLLASITLTGVWARSDGAGYRAPGRTSWAAMTVAFSGLILVGASGAIAALGDTLFPAADLATALAEDFNSSTRLLVRLRVLHPFLAIAAGGYVLLGLRLDWFGEKSEQGQMIKRRLAGLIVLQWAAGAVNVVLLAPIWLQLLHLFIADLVWLAFVVYVEAQLFPKTALRPLQQ